MQDVGWPDPAAVVAIMERILSLRALSLIVSTTEAEGAACEVALMGFGSLESFSWAEVEVYIGWGKSASLFRCAAPLALFGIIIEV